jgi:hypothetical protein
MAATTLVPTGVTDAAALVASGDETQIDNTIAAFDDAELLSTNVNDISSGSVTFSLTDVPAGAVISAAQFQTRAEFVNPGTGDSCNYICTLTGAALPATSTATWTEADENAGFANRGATGGSESCTPTEANANAWTVVFTQTGYSKAQSPDGMNFDISEIEVIITYTIPAGGVTPHNPFGIALSGPFSGPIG